MTLKSAFRAELPEGSPTPQGAFSVNTGTRPDVLSFHAPAEASPLPGPSTNQPKPARFRCLAAGRRSCVRRSLTRTTEVVPVSLIDTTEVVPSGPPDAAEAAPAGLSLHPKVPRESLHAHRSGVSGIAATPPKRGASMCFLPVQTPVTGRMKGVTSSHSPVGTSLQRSRFRRPLRPHHVRKHTWRRCKASSREVVVSFRAAASEPLANQLLVTQLLRA